MNKIELKWEGKLYKVELPELEEFTGQLALVFHCKHGVLMEAIIEKKGSVNFPESFQQNTQLHKDIDMLQ